MRHTSASVSVPHASSSGVGFTTCGHTTQSSQPPGGVLGWGRLARLAQRVRIQERLQQRQRLPRARDVSTRCLELRAADAADASAQLHCRRRAPPTAPHLLLGAVKACHQQRARLGADAEALERLCDLQGAHARRAATSGFCAGCAHAHREHRRARALLVGDKLNTRSLCSVRVVGLPAAAAASALCAPRCSTKALGTMAAFTNAASGCSAPATIFSRSSLQRTHAASHASAPADEEREVRPASQRAARHAPAVGNVRKQRGAQRAARKSLKRKRRRRHGGGCAAAGGAAWRSTPLRRRKRGPGCAQRLVQRVRR